MADKLLYHPGKTDRILTSGQPAGHDKIEKRKSKRLANMMKKLDQYQITDGLTEDDYIAYPEDSITEGEKVTKNIEDIYGNSDDGSDGSMDDGCGFGCHERI